MWKWVGVAMAERIYHEGEKPGWGIGWMSCKLLMCKGLEDFDYGVNGVGRRSVFFARSLDVESWWGNPPRAVLRSKSAIGCHRMLSRAAIQAFTWTEVVRLS